LTLISDEINRKFVNITYKLYNITVADEFISGTFITLKDFLFHLNGLIHIEGPIGSLHHRVVVLVLLIEWFCLVFILCIISNLF